MIQEPTDTPVTILLLVTLVVQTVGVSELKVTRLPDAPPIADTAPMPSTIKVGAAPKVMD